MNHPTSQVPVSPTPAPITLTIGEQMTVRVSATPGGDLSVSLIIGEQRVGTVSALSNGVTMVALADGDGNDCCGLTLVDGVVVRTGQCPESVALRPLAEKLAKEVSDER